jgi:two-component system cell cycle sensor histidine kinase/response regulator CckA
VSYGIVASHGGTIELARTGSEGTTFRISLPAAEPELPDDDELALTTARATRGRRSPLAGLRVLFVDDEDALRSAAESFARARGFTVLAAADGLEALDLVRSPASTPWCATSACRA